MTIHRLNADVLALEDLDPFCQQLLQEIPSSADPQGSSDAEARLFPAPTRGAEPASDEDWREYVAPDLRESFKSAVDVVQADLRRLPEHSDDAPATLRIPCENLEAWVHTLNQARLTLTARHGFTEEELERHLELEGSSRALALLRVHFYGLLLELFLRELE
ncbi:MAG TPA: DUF2017 family protein [Chthoniobacterales bacterium]|jgi:hypothetical protein